jgi:hypothetical protein
MHFLSPPIIAICPAHHNLFGSVTLTVLGNLCNSRSSSLWNILNYPIISSFLSPGVSPSTLQTDVMNQKLKLWYSYGFFGPNYKHIVLQARFLRIDSSFVRDHAVKIHVWRTKISDTRVFWTSCCYQVTFWVLHTKVYPKVSGLAAFSENCKWYSSLPLGAFASLFCESV